VTITDGGRASAREGDGMIESITIIGGRGKSGDPEPVQRIDLQMGNVASIVGPTGSGKTTFINDIELFADGDTPSMRRVLINGERPPKEYRHDPSKNPIALITQHTTFLSDLPVGEFLRTHASVRVAKTSHREGLIEATIAFANQLTGEAIPLDARMTELSGGQTRSLLIADATIICDTPIVLLDEVENAGINRSRALELLRQQRKIFIFVTHDPRITLLSDFRIVVSEGRVMKILGTNAEERQLATHVSRIDDILGNLREKLRLGFELNGNELEGVLA
jgi:ABC-type lipoprotein export system ATPase subunit